MKEKKIKNKKDIGNESEIDIMSIGQCENALTELMAELEALSADEPSLAGISADAKAESAPSDADFKELDGKKAGGEAVFAFTLTDIPEEIEDNIAEENSGASEKMKSAYDIYGETLFESAARLVVEEGVTSVSFLQRSLGIGYDKAAQIVERLEELSVVSPLDGNRPRKVLVSSEKLEKILSDLKERNAL